MENSLKGLILAAGVVITLVVVGLGFYISREAQDTANSGISQISKMNSELTESDKELYDGLLVSGSEVVNVINKFKKEDMGIIVVNKKGSIDYIHKVTVTTGGEATLGTAVPVDLSNTKVVTNDAYINNNAQFAGEVLRDSNNAIVAIRFTQK